MKHRGVSEDCNQLLFTPQQIQEFLDSIEDFIFIVSKQGIIVNANQTACKRLGYCLDELKGMDVLDLHPSSKRLEAMEIMKNIFLGKTDICPIDLLCKDGELIPVETKIVRGKWEEEDLLFAISRDHSHQRRTEKLLNEHQQQLAHRKRFEEMVTSISKSFFNIPYLEIDHAINTALQQIGEIEEADRSCIFLIDHDEKILFNTHEWCAPGIQPQKQHLQKISFDSVSWWMGKLMHFETIHIPSVSDMPSQANNEKIMLENQGIKSALAVPLAIDDKVIGFFGFDAVKRSRCWTQDSIRLIQIVGEMFANAIRRKHMENELHQIQRYNEALLDAIPDFIFCISQQGQILDFKAQEGLDLCLPREKITGLHIREVFFPSELKRLLALIDQVILQNTTLITEYALTINGQVRFFEACIKRLKKDEVIAVSRDITQRRHLEELKTDFINRAAHDLRTPIATMKIMVELLDAHPFEEEERSYWNILKDELQRQKLLIEDILCAGLLESGTAGYSFKQVELHELLRKVISEYEVSIRKKYIRLTLNDTFQDQNALCWIYADIQAMVRVFSNLLSNAVKFTSFKGTIRIDVIENDNEIIVSIADNGMGIAQEDLPFIFQRFYRGQNAVTHEIQGTGLGLYIIQSIVEKHGGRIQVLSKPGKGSTFKVILPRNIS